MWAKHKQTGFTIVELLIVIVVIAILAAITIVAYNGIQNRAKASAASQALSDAVKKIKYAQAELDSGAALDCIAFSSALGATPASCTPTVGSVNYQYTQDLGGTYCITATVGNKSHRVTGTNSTTVAEACAGHGSGGIPAITNLSVNPTAAVNGSNWSTVVSTNGVASGARVTLVTGLGAINTTTAWRTTITTAPDTWWRNVHGTFAVTAGQPYTYSAYVRPSVTVPTALIIIWRNASNVTISESASAVASQSAGTWERKSVTATAPAGATSAILHSGAISGGVAGAYFDTSGVMLTQGSTLHGYADGNSPNWAWTNMNTPNNSTSTGPPQ